jgi:hypothetical protein
VREALDPPIDTDVIDVDPTVTQEFFDVAVRQSVPQIPAQGEDDDLGREPKTDERRTRDCRYYTATARHHPATLTA